MTTPLSAAESLLASALLELAGDKFSSHGCNDFDVRDVGLTPEESEALWKDLALWNGDPPEDIGEGPIHYDWMLMNYLSDRIAGVWPRDEP